MPLFWLSLAFLGGILLASCLSIPTFAWLLLAGACLLVTLLRFLLPRTSLFTHYAARIPFGLQSTTLLQHLPRLGLPLPLLLLFLALFLGAARYEGVQPHFSADDIAWYALESEAEPPQVAVEGLVVEPPEEADKSTSLIVWAERLRLPGSQGYQPVKGKIIARVSPGITWHYGDRVRLEGILQLPSHSAEFSYREYLGGRGIYAEISFGRASLLASGQGKTLLAAVYSFKERALSTVWAIFPDPEAPLIAGILLGSDARIPAHLSDDFKATGASHIIAISGFNIGILGALFGGLFGKLLGARRRLTAFLLSVGCIGVYTILVGASASVVRAALMGTLSLFAVQIGRRQDGLNSLAFVAALMALGSPMVLWDVGFQLSFAATLGLVLYADRLSGAFARVAARFLPGNQARWLAGPVGEYILFTFAAQLTSLPVTIYHFQRFSLVSFFANPLLLPPQPPLMIVSGAAVLLGMLFLPVGKAVGALAWPFAAFTIRVVEVFARFPGGSIPLGKVSLALVVIYYALLFGWSFSGPRLGKLAAALRPSMALIGLIALAAVTWRATLGAPDGRLHVTLLEVGNGDAILIRTPTGRNLLIDGGPSAASLSEGLGRRLAFTERSLDLLVIARPETGEVDAIPAVLERFPPDRVLWAGPENGDRQAAALQAALVESVIPVTLAQTGIRVELGKNACLRVLYAGKQGAVLLLEWNRFRALFPIGLDLEGMKALENGRMVGNVTALMLSDGGYAPANPPEWIHALNPRLLLLSVDPTGKRRLPSPETLQAVTGYPLLRTDRNGWIHLATDGEKMWVEVERK